MSLAEDKPPRRRVRQNGIAAKDALRSSCEPRDFKDILIRVFDAYAQDPEAKHAPAGGPRDLARDCASVRQGRIDFDALRAECDRLEIEVTSLRRRTRLDVDVLSEERARWQDLAEDRGEQLRRSQAQLSEALDVSARLHARLEAESANLEAARRRNTVLAQIAMALHDKIMDRVRPHDPAVAPPPTAAAA